MDVFSRNGLARCLLFGVIVAALSGNFVSGADPDIVTDFGINVTSGADLHFTGFRNHPDQPEGTVHIDFAFNTQFPGVKGLGIAPSYIKFGPNSINPFHTHPRSSEVFIVLDGELDAGILSTSNKLFTATLQNGDVFVFPKGLMHFQINRSLNTSSTVIAAFDSENAGRVSIPPALFNSEARIPTDVLMRTFFLDEDTVERVVSTSFPGVS